MTKRPFRPIWGGCSPNINIFRYDFPTYIFIGDTPLSWYTSILILFSVLKFLSISFFDLPFFFFLEQRKESSQKNQRRCGARARHHHLRFVGLSPSPCRKRRRRERDDHEKRTRAGIRQGGGLLYGGAVSNSFRQKLQSQWYFRLLESRGWRWGGSIFFPSNS